jgi:Predicted membrane protein
MVTILFRTLIIYVLLLCAMKIMGKRQIGELEISDLVTTLMLSELAVTPISDNNTPLSHAVVPILILISFEIIATFISTKNNTLKKFMIAKPSYIINKGVLQQKELEKTRMSINEFIGELRLKDVGDIKNVNYAILESNGQMSVFLKNTDQTSTIAHSIVIDGQICEQSLISLGYNQKWLFKKLAEYNCPIKETFLFTIDDDKQENLIRRER